jgi:hypothetical protein
MFCVESADELDFGIYRIMNYKKKKIEEFIDNLDDEVKFYFAPRL